MYFKAKEILDEKNKLLRTKSREVTFPLDKKDKNLIKKMLSHLELSQIPEYSDKFDLRPGTGLSPVQLGIPKRFFVVVYETEDGDFEKYVLINPELISHSEEEVYVPEGEGCLSVNRPTDGIVDRYKRVTFKAQDIDGKEFEIRVTDELAIIFQHELDHLDGILFVDRLRTADEDFETSYSL